MSRRKRYWTGAAVAAALLLGLDLSRPPERQASASVLLFGIDAYQATLSKLMPTLGVRCRFQPTCSRYAEGAIRRHGALAGSGRAFWRLLRCGPWTERGTVDPP